MDRPTYLFVPARTEWGDSVGDNSGGRIRFLFGKSLESLLAFSFGLDFSGIEVVVLDDSTIEFKDNSLEGIFVLEDIIKDVSFLNGATIALGFSTTFPLSLRLLIPLYDSSWALLKGNITGFSIWEIDGTAPVIIGALFDVI